MWNQQFKHSPRTLNKMDVVSFLSICFLNWNSKQYLPYFLLVKNPQDHLIPHPILFFCTTNCFLCLYFSNWQSTTHLKDSPKLNHINFAFISVLFKTKQKKNNNNKTKKASWGIIHIIPVGFSLSLWIPLRVIRIIYTVDFSSRFYIPSCSKILSWPFVNPLPHSLSLPSGWLTSPLSWRHIIQNAHISMLPDGSPTWLLHLLKLL